MATSAAARLAAQSRVAVAVHVHRSSTCQPGRRVGLSDLAEDVVEEPVGRERRPLRFEPGRERAIEIGLHRHAIRSRSNGTTRLSASMAARIVFVPRWSRDFAVPTGMPRMSAIAASGNPSR